MKPLHLMFLGFMFGALVFIPITRYFTAQHYIKDLGAEQDRLWSEIHFVTQDKDQLYRRTIELIKAFEDLGEQIEYIRIFKNGILESQIFLGEVVK